MFTNLWWMWAGPSPSYDTFHQSMTRLYFHRTSCSTSAQHRSTQGFASSRSSCWAWGPWGPSTIWWKFGSSSEPRYYFKSVCYFPTSCYDQLAMCLYIDITFPNMPQPEQGTKCNAPCSWAAKWCRCQALPSNPTERSLVQSSCPIVATGSRHEWCNQCSDRCHNGNPPLNHPLGAIV